MSRNVNSNSSHLRILNSSTVRQIESAQVIPSYESLATSLLQNSVESGASRVHIKLQPASLRVTVVDNGNGLHHDEWGSLFSKRLSSQGRSRTLRSVAAVACVEVSSSRSDIHLRKTIRGGIVLEDVIQNTSPISLFSCTGVIVDVWELFYNLPVRRRAALQIPAAKLVDNVRRRIVAVALSNVHVHVKLEMNSSVVLFESPPLAKLSVSLLESAFATRHRLSWLPVNTQDGSLKVHGYIAELALSRATEAQIVSINGVPLDHSARVYKLLRKASRENMSQEVELVSQSRAYPAFVLNVLCDEEDVQVSAAEHGAIIVGYKNMDVEQFVTNSVMSVLRAQRLQSNSRSYAAITGGKNRGESAGCSRQENAQSRLALRARKRIWKDIDNHDFKEAVLDLSEFVKKSRDATLKNALPQRPLSATESRFKRLSRLPSPSSSLRVRRPQTAAAVMCGLTKNLPNWKNPCFQYQGRTPNEVATVKSGCTSSIMLLDMSKVRVEREALRSMRVIGQVDLKFIMATDERGTLYAIDQHAASERALFETLLRELGQGTVLTQSVVPPMVLPLSTEQRSLVVRLWSDLHRWGWQLSQSNAEGFYSGTVRVHGVPCIGPQGISIDGADQFMTFVDELAEGASAVCVPTPFRDAIATAACHAAVRFGDTVVDGTVPGYCAGNGKM